MVQKLKNQINKIMKIVKNKSLNSGLVAIRKRLGLSQEQLGAHLKLSRSTIKLAEQGQRSLPTAALLQVAQLEIKLATEPQAEKHELPHPAEKSSLEDCKRRYALLFAREAKCRLQRRKLEAKQRVLSVLYQKTREWLKVIEDSMKENRHDPTVVQWWKRQQQSAVKTLNSCSLPVQILLRSKMTLLEAEAGLYREMQERLKQELPSYFIKEASVGK